MNHPLLLVLLIAASIYVANAWWTDVRDAQAGQPNPRGFPGATTAPAMTYVIAVIGALAILAAETAGEIALGVDTQQSRITWLFALYSIAGAPVIEELIFRGWLVVESRGRAVMWLAAVAASFAFALLHPFLWQWDDSGFTLQLTLKGWLSAVVVFALSLWLYITRLASWNPRRSLMPCIVAHAAKNLGVVAIKAAGGYVGGIG